MIEINATYFVQIIHFLFMWWLLDRFFFPVVVGHVHKEEATLQSIKQSILNEQDKLLFEQNKQRVEWQQFRDHFKKHAPQIDVTPPFAYSTVLCSVIEPFSKEAQEKIIKDMKAVIIKKAVKHV